VQRPRTISIIKIKIKVTPVKCVRTSNARLVRFEVLTAVVMKSIIFWDIMSCSPLKVNLRFGGTCHLHLQGWRVCQARNRHETGMKKSSAFRLAYSSTVKTEAICSSYTSLDYQRTARRYIRENKTLQYNIFSTEYTYILLYTNIYWYTNGVIRPFITFS
jgi:hypothetical protein